MIIASQAIRRHVRLLLRFGTIGLLTAGVYACMLWVAVEIIHLPPAIGVAIAYVLAIALNYLGHYFWTYDSDSLHHMAGWRYLIVVISIFTINVTTTAFLPTLLEVSYWFAQLLVGLLMAGMTLFSFTYWVFAPQPR